MEEEMTSKFDKIDQIKRDAQNEKQTLQSDKRELTQERETLRISVSLISWNSH